MERLSLSPAYDWRADLRRLAEPLRNDDARLPLYERLLREMPPYLRERVNGEVMILRSVFTDPKNHLTPEQMEAAVNQRVMAGYREVATDPALSHNGTQIQSYQCLRPLIAHDLERELVSSEAPRVIDHTGAIFLDVDGMKTIVDCTNHRNACAYLQRLADLLVRPPEALAQWCQEQGLSTEAYSVGGDEFFVLVRSQAMLTDEKLGELETRFHHEIQNDAVLATRFVDFDDPSFLLDYGFVDDVRREQILALETDDERRAALSDVRNQLPARFVPSVSIGSARFSIALSRAVEQSADKKEETKEQEPFEDVAFNAFQMMTDAADGSAKRRKEAKKQRLKEENSPLYAFFLRNAEGRSLANELAAKERIIVEQQEIIRQLTQRLAG